LLNHAVTVRGGAENRFAYAAPGLGRIDVRAVRAECRALIGKRDLGYGPWTPIAVAAGNYRVDLVCPDGQNPFMQTTVTQGRTSQVRFQK
jgi:hypothetical protein